MNRCCRRLFKVGYDLRRMKHRNQLAMQSVCSTAPYSSLDFEMSGRFGERTTVNNCGWYSNDATQTMDMEQYSVAMGGHPGLSVPTLTSEPSYTTDMASLNL